MTKIKNFRITLRPREMARWLKRERGLETTPELELSIEQIIKEGKAWIEPAAVYTTLTRQVAEKTTEIVFPDRSMAVSVVAVSIGALLEKERSAAQALRESLLSALAHEALSQALQFVVRLVQDQAKEEECDMSTLASTPEAVLTTSLATLLGIQRIGIPLETSFSALPSHARVTWLFWTPAGKGTAKRVEKVAA